LAPGDFPKKTILVNSGAEAIENSIKIARAYTKRPAVICFEDAFHGRTLLTMSLTSKTHPYKAGFQPFASDIYRIPYAYPYRHAAGTSAEDFARHLRDAFKRSVAPESVAAVLAEPVLGEGGFVVPPRDYFRLLQKICREHGILFIADEVQSGFGRTGKWFASEHFGIEPDLIAMAKSLGGGMPIAAVTGRAEIMDAPGPGALGGTFCAHPLSCAAALAVIEAIEKDGLLARSAVIGGRFEKRAFMWQKKWDLVGDVRGLGGMCAIELVRNAATREPADTETKQIARYCYEHGLITVTAGTFNNVIRILVPLVVTDEQFDEGLDVIEAALASVAEPGRAALSRAYPVALVGAAFRGGPQLTTTPKLSSRTRSGRLRTVVRDLFSSLPRPLVISSEAKNLSSCRGRASARLFSRCFPYVLTSLLLYFLPPRQKRKIPPLASALKESPMKNLGVSLVLLCAAVAAPAVHAQGGATAQQQPPSTAS